jgi:hypothetical protein
MIDKLGGRKAFFSLVAIIVGVAIAFIKGDLPPNLLNLLQFVLGAFVTGNLVAGATDAVTAVQSAKAENPVPSEPTAQVDLSPVLASIKEIGEQNQKTQDGLITVQQGILAIIRKAGLDKIP